MPVSGIVIKCLAGHAPSVVEALTGMNGVEVHGIADNDQIVAVVEADTVQQEVDIVSRLHEFANVVSVQMAYHNFEDLAEQPDAHPEHGHP